MTWSHTWKPAGRKWKFLPCSDWTPLSQGHTRSLRHNKPQDCSCLKGRQSQPQHSINLETQVPFLFPSLLCAVVGVGTGPRALTREIYLWVDSICGPTFQKVGIHEILTDQKVWTHTERADHVKKFQFYPWDWRMLREVWILKVLWMACLMAISQAYHQIRTFRHWRISLSFEAPAQW